MGASSPSAPVSTDTLIRLGAVPAGEHLLCTPTLAPDGALGGLQMSVVRRVPSCVPESDSGIGAGYVAPGAPAPADVHPRW